MNNVFNHPQLGTITIEFRRNSRSITARWRDNRVHVIAPMSLTGPQIYQTIEQMVPKLLNSRPKHSDDSIAADRRVEFDGVTVIFSRQSLQPEKVLGYPRLPEAGIAIGTDLDPSAPSTITTVRKLTAKLGARLAERIVLPRAMEIARTLHLHPRDWRVGHGRSTLGTCSGSRVITLSGRLTFYPSALRDYIVCHELAHMSEMNHSARFHEICDTYCRAILSTPESILKKELKKYTRSLSGDLF